MSRSDLLKKISRAITPDDTAIDFSVFDKQISELKDKLKEKIQAKTLDDVNNRLDKFRKSIDLNPLVESLKQLQDSISKKEEELSSLLDRKSSELNSLIENGDASNTEKITSLTSEIEYIKSDIEELQKPQPDRITPIVEGMANLEKRLKKSISTEKENILNEVSSLGTSGKKALTKESENIMSEIDKLRMDMFSRISRLGGGSMNRQIFINNADPLKMFTDINLKAGTNVTITYANNNTTKKVDVTLTATGGSSGTVRSINSISTPQTAGATAGTDYVYLVSGTTQLTMPTAVGNTNLYTIKNVGTGTVTVAFAGVETCDGSTTIVMPTQFTSVDIISDTVNWNIT